MGKLTGLRCRLFGHEWGWPDIPLAIGAGALHMGMLWRSCRRCGVRQADEKNETLVIVGPLFCGDPRECSFNPPVQCQDFEALGHKVKRAMGWSNERPADD